MRAGLLGVSAGDRDGVLKLTGVRRLTDLKRPGVLVDWRRCGARWSLESAPTTTGMAEHGGGAL
jgi:hypothetical protein